LKHESELRSDIDPEIADEIDRELTRHREDAFEWARHFDDRLSRANFITNGSGALASLAFVGSGGDLALVWVSLISFSMGVLFSVAELTTQKDVYMSVVLDAAFRQRGWRENKLNVEQVSALGDLPKWSSFASKYSSLLSRYAFILGVLSGIELFMLSAL